MILRDKYYALPKHYTLDTSINHVVYAFMKNLDIQNI